MAINPNKTPPTVYINEELIKDWYTIEDDNLILPPFINEKRKRITFNDGRTEIHPSHLVDIIHH